MPVVSGAGTGSGGGGRGRWLAGQGSRGAPQAGAVAGEDVGFLRVTLRAAHSGPEEAAGAPGVVGGERRGGGEVFRWPGRGQAALGGEGLSSGGRGRCRGSGGLVRWLSVTGR